MSSSDEKLRKYFDEQMRRCKDVSAREVLEDIIEWFKKLHVFENIKIQEADVKEAFNKLKIQASITYEQFLKVLKELADKNKIGLEELKSKLLEQMEIVDVLDKKFQEELKKGKASIKDVLDWLERNQILDKIKLMEADVVNAFDELKRKVDSINCEDLSEAMKDLAAKYDIDLDNFIKQLMNPGSLPSASGKKDDPREKK